MASDERQNAKPNVDSSLLGGLIPTDSINLKTSDTTPFLRCLSANHACSFLVELDTVEAENVVDPDLLGTSQGPETSRSNEQNKLRSFFGNVEYASFLTTIAWIPIWGNDTDLIGTFSTEYRLMGQTKEKEVHRKDLA